MTRAHALSLLAIASLTLARPGACDDSNWTWLRSEAGYLLPAVKAQALACILEVDRVACVKGWLKLFRV
jgi:hypothetical protein